MNIQSSCDNWWRYSFFLLHDWRKSFSFVFKTGNFGEWFFIIITSGKSFFYFMKKEIKLYSIFIEKLIVCFRNVIIFSVFYAKQLVKWKYKFLLLWFGSWICLVTILFFLLQPVPLQFIIIFRFNHTEWFTFPLTLVSPSLVYFN